MLQPVDNEDNGGRFMQWAASDLAAPVDDGPVRMTICKCHHLAVGPGGEAQFGHRDLRVEFIAQPGERTALGCGGACLRYRRADARAALRREILQDDGSCR